jgi:hypothetical protein
MKFKLLGYRPETIIPERFQEGASCKQVETRSLFNKFKRRYIHVPHSQGPATRNAGRSLSTISAMAVSGLMATGISTSAMANGFDTNVAGLLNDHIRLGTGYNRDTNEFINVQTVDGRVDETLGNTVADTDLTIDGSYDEALSILNGKVDLDVTFPVVRVQAGADLAKEMTATEFSNTYTFQAWLTPKKRTLQPRDANVGYTVTSAGNTLATQYQSQLMALAGDSYISEIEYGAQLLVNMRVEYLSEQHKTDIGGYIGVDYGKGNIGVNVDGQLRYIDEDLKKSVRISVRAVQKGGDPKQLLNIIPSNIISCSLDNYEPCFDLFVDAVNYAKNDFSNQFNSLSDYNVVRYSATPYSVSSLDVRRLDPATEEPSFSYTVKVRQLEDAFKEAIRHENRARSVLAKYSSWMTEAQRTAAEQVKAGAYNNAWIYNEYALMCRNNPYGSACKDNWDDYVAQCGTANYPACLETYSVSDLNIEQGNLTQYFECERARESTANFGVETNETSLGLREMSLAPVLVDPNDPAVGALAWVPCKHALPSYGTAFEQ